MPAFPVGDPFRVVILGTVLLVIPGYLALLALAPRMGHAARAAVGAGLTAAALGLGVWGARHALARPLLGSDIWLLYGAFLAAAALAALLTRREWSPLSRLVPTRRMGALAAILAFAAVTLYGPRLDYFLPLHVDEWHHLTVTTAMSREAAGDFPLGTRDIWSFAGNPAISFHAWLFAMGTLTGATLLGLFHALPLVVGVLLVLAAYAAGEREGYGLEAALVVSLLPTSLRLLGPQYVVPLATGLFLIPCAFLLFTADTRWRTLPGVALLMAFVFFAHPQSAAAAGFLIGTYAVLTARRSWANALALLAVASVPFWLGPLLLPRIVNLEGLTEASSRLPIPEFVFLFGPVLLAFFVAGAFLTFLRSTPERLAWIATTALHLAVVLAFILFGIGQANLYDRAWMHAGLTAAFTAAYALHRARVRLSALPRVPAPVVALGLAALLLLPSVAAQREREEEYYHVIDAAELEELLWIRDHVEMPPNTTALVDPWQGPAFFSITGIPVTASFPHHFYPPRNQTASTIAATRVLSGGFADDRFLDRFGVALIWTDLPVRSANFTEKHPDVWVRENVTVRP